MKFEPRLAGVNSLECGDLTALAFGGLTPQFVGGLMRMVAAIGRDQPKR